MCRRWRRRGGGGCVARVQLNCDQHWQCNVNECAVQKIDRRKQMMTAREAKPLAQNKKTTKEVKENETQKAQIQYWE